MFGELSTKRCPLCWSPLLFDGERYWCSFIGDEQEKDCSFVTVTKPSGVNMSKIEWRNGGELYLGRVYVGEIRQWGANGPNAHRWRGWFMNNSDGSETGWFDTEEAARLSVMAALNSAINE